VCTEAVHELKNEEEVRLIDEKWKITFLNIKLYPKKGDHEKIYAINSTDDIKQQLEDHIMALQGVASSKYARSVKKQVTQWEKDLNMIGDVIQTWLLTQGKWMYLENIFSGEDIKQQLPEQARKFTNIDKKWAEIMSSVEKNKNVRYQCVQAENGTRYDQLQSILLNLENLQKSLTVYLESKRMTFPRFYALSEEDLL